MSDTKDEKAYTPEVQKTANRELCDGLARVLAELRTMKDGYEGCSVTDVLEEMVELVHDMTDSLNDWLDITEPNLPEQEPVVCKFVMKRGVKKGQECGKLDCTTKGHA